MKIDSNKKIGFFLYCNREEKVLLHFRDNNTSNSPLMWDCFGGAIEGDEKPNETLARELFEELRISARIGDTKLVLQNSEAWFYCIKFPFEKTGEIIIEEGGGVGWLSLDCALDMKNLTEEAKKVLIEFKNNLAIQLQNKTQRI